MTDINNKNNIIDVAESIGINEKDLLLFGNDKAKIKTYGNKKTSKLILVTATSPTPLGEGKTTVSIGLADALNKLNKKTILTLREPSMGPVFGMKGGATGGGMSQVIPSDDINLHFTGDFHAITMANNLICAAIDNHIYRGNKLDIKEVLFNRCLDVNDRSLRNIGNTSFNITAASEIMSIICLANDYDDLKNRLSNVIIGINSDNKYIYLKDLNIVGSLLVILKDAFLPNLVQTLESTPTIIHGGPFANIAHGCNSIKATKIALSYADYVVTEAGFGSDLGAEKFFNIKCRESNIKPDCTVLVTTIKALKYNGGVDKDNILKKNNNALKEGFNNLLIHYNNLKKFNSNIIVCLNKFSTDTKEEIKILEELCSSNNMLFSICDSFSKGSLGSIELAKLVLENVNNNSFNLLYDTRSSIKEKIDVISKEIYRAKEVIYNDDVIKKIELIENNKLDKLPICISKTQYSLSDNPKNIANRDYNITVTDIKVSNGAGFIVILLGNVITMPGLPKKPNYENMDLVDNKIVEIK